MVKRNWISADKRLAIHLRDSFMCVYCSVDLRNVGRGELTLDHYIPVRAGGSNGSGNLVTCCLPCNDEKGNMPAADYFQVLGRRRGYHQHELAHYIAGGMARAEFQMSRPLNRRLAKALIDDPQPSPFNHGQDPWPAIIPR